MQFTSIIAAMAMTASTVFAMDGSCSNSNHAGAWRDSKNPAERVQDLCDRQTNSCWNGDQGVGVMCLAGNSWGDCEHLVDAAIELQSWHGSWWLEDRITCGGLTVTVTSQ